MNAEPRRRRRVGVVFGEGSANIRDILTCASDVAEPVLVFDAADESLEGLRLALQGDVDCVSYSRGEDDALRSWHRQSPVDAITTFSEGKLRLAAHIAEVLDLPYHSIECADRLTDKSAQRAALARAGLGLEFRVAENARRAGEIVRDFGVPSIVKPLRGTGGRNTYAVDPESLPAAGPDHPAQTYPAVVEVLLERGRHPASDLLADVVSVETVFVADRPRHFGVTARFPLAEPFRETGSVFPSQLPQQVRAAAEELATRALDALGVTSGMTHTEIKLTPDGLRVLEVNGRLGGWVGRLTELSTGVSAVRLGLLAACGEPAQAPTPDAVAAVSLLAPPVGARHLVSRVPAAELRALPGVVAVEVKSRPGDPVDHHQGADAHVACVWYVRPDWASLATAHRRATEIVEATVRWE